VRFIYSLLLSFLLPFILLRLYWKGSKIPEYRCHWQERLGIYNTQAIKDVVWVHAVSVGEAEAVFPLIKRIQQQFPAQKIVVTTTTPTGRERVRAVLGKSVEQVFLPYDTVAIVKRFFKQFKPSLAIIMEKEIWPNLFFHCAKNNIPLYIINARLSASSAKNYKKIPTLVQPALSCCAGIFTQTEDDKNRFIAIGASKPTVQIMGNIKFDVKITADILEKGQQLKITLFSKRFIWIIASTHKGEEEVFMSAYKQLKVTIPNLLLLIVPRHPERANEIFNLATSQQLQLTQRSTNSACLTQTDIYLADTIGELKMLYAASDIAFVGGSMVPIGGHNILEPLAIGLPVLYGPFMQNFQEIADNTLKIKAAIQCQNENELIKAVIHLYNDPEFKLSLTTQGLQFLNANQGSVERIYNKLKHHFN